jgi:hypothetical protein
LSLHAPAPNISGLRQSALYLLWRSTQDEFEPVTGKGFPKCAQGRVVTPNSTEPGTASCELGVTDAERSSAHHTVSVDMAPFRNWVHVAHRSSLQSYEKICPLDHLFLAARAKAPGLPEHT